MKKILLGLLVLGMVAAATAIPAHANAADNAQDAVQTVESQIPEDPGLSEDVQNDQALNNSNASNGGADQARNGVERGPPENAGEGPVQRGPPEFVQDLMPAQALANVPSFFWN